MCDFDIHCMRKFTVSSLSDMSRILDGDFSFITHDSSFDAGSSMENDLSALE